MNTPAKRRANDAHIRRKLDAGYKRKAFILSPEACRRLAELAEGSSETAAVEKWLTEEK